MVRCIKQNKKIYTNFFIFVYNGCSSASDTFVIFIHKSATNFVRILSWKISRSMNKIMFAIANTKRAEYYVTHWNV